MIGRNVVLCDIDHTISDAFWRDNMIGGPGGWDAYHACSVDDAPLNDMIDLINTLQPTYRLIGLTARPEKWRKLTMDWLLRHGVMLDGLLMRADDAFHPAPALKTELVLSKFNLNEIAFILDDREDVIAAFRALGVTALQVHAR